MMAATSALMVQSGMDDRHDVDRAGERESDGDEEFSAHRRISK
jgi:hypothetical protein